QACRRLLEEWIAVGPTALNDQENADIQAYLAKLVKQPDFMPLALGQRIEKATQAGTPTESGTTPGEVLAGMLAKLEEQLLQPLAQEDPANWAKQALTRIKDWLGSAEGESDLGDWRKTRLTRALVTAAQKVADEWDQYLSKDLFALMESPGGRVAAAETGLEQVRKHCLKI